MDDDNNDNNDNSDNNDDNYCSLLSKQAEPCKMGG